MITKEVAREMFRKIEFFKNSGKILDFVLGEYDN